MKASDMPPGYALARCCFTCQYSNPFDRSDNDNCLMHSHLENVIVPKWGCCDSWEKREDIEPVWCISRGWELKKKKENEAF
jgi:hypothetical protein